MARPPRPVLILALACLGSVLAAGEPEAVPLPDQVNAILEAVPADPEEPVWQEGEQLASLGQEACPPLEQALSRPQSGQVLAAAYALLRLRVNRPAVEALERAARDAQTPLARRIDIVSLLAEHGGALGLARIRMLLADEKLAAANGMPELLQVACARSLLKMTRNPNDGRLLRQIMTAGRSARARAEAAFALAESGSLADAEELLAKLQDSPGEIGERAAVLLQLRQEQEKLAKSDRLPGYLINEVLLDIRKFYAPDATDREETEQLDPKSMASVIARSLLNSIDPFSDYLTEDDWNDMVQSLHSNYGGIGAWVGMRENRFTILTPMYDKPAYKAGLRSMDVVDKIDDKDIKGMRLNDIIKMLKGPPNTEVFVTIRREGWVKPQKFKVVRDTIDVPSVQSQALPGDIAYIRLNSFAEGEPDKGVKGTDELLHETLVAFDKKGVKGVVLDLTNNPGGLLLTAVNVASKFIGHGKLIVSKRGKAKLQGQNSFFAEQGDPLYTGPLVVLINQGSASASEIVSGALKDHERARLVGERTFGKGSIQQPIPAWTTGGHIKLTVGYYYLPSGRCIHGPYRDDGGITPSVEVKEPEMSVPEFEARFAIRDSHEIEKWLEKNFETAEAPLRELLAFDGYSSEKYPQFDEVFALLKEKHPDAALTKDLVRQELRFGLIAYLRNHRGEEHHVDPQENLLLQRGLLVLGEAIPGGLPDLPLYNALRQKQEEEQKKLAAAKEAGPTATPAATTQ